MKMAETITTTDLVSRFTTLKQDRFSGHLLVKIPMVKNGIFAYSLVEFCMQVEVNIQSGAG